MRWPRSLALAVLAVACVVLPGAPVGAGSTGTVLADTASTRVVRDGAWVRWEYRDALASSSVVVYQGQAVPGGGCRYGGTERVRPGAVPAGMEVVEREIAHNASACQMRVERGLAPQRTVADGGRTAAREALVAGGARGGAGIAASTGAYHKTYYEDPVQIDVTSVTAELRWSYDWYCVTNSWDHWGRWGWYSPSGWVRDNHSVNAYRDCNGATTIVYGLFHNDPFCYPYTTWNEYDVTVVKGLKDGGYWMQWNAYKWGGCTGLLSFHRSHGRI